MFANCEPVHQTQDGPEKKWTHKEQTPQHEITNATTLDRHIMNENYEYTGYVVFKWR